MKTLTELMQDAINSLQLVADNVPSVEIVSESAIPAVSIGPVTPAAAEANTVAIRRTLASRGRCDLPPGIVRINNDIRVASGNQIRGFGTSDNPSVLQVVPGSPAVAARGPSKSWYSIFQSNTAAAQLVGDTFGLPIGSAHGVTIRDLVLDCGFDEQIKDSQGRIPTTTQAISIEGLGMVVEDVVIRNCGKGTGGGECFGVRMFAPATKVSERRASRLSRLRCEHIGSAGQTHGGLGGDEITLFSLVGSPANILIAPVIEGCVVSGLRRGPMQPSPIQVFHSTYAFGDIVRNNTVLDSDATCVYRDTGTSSASRVHSNTFRNVHRGVFFNAMTDFLARDFSIDGNRIEIYNDKPVWSVNGTPAGILLQGAGFNRGHFSNNVIVGIGGGFGTQQFYSRGIYLELRGKTDAVSLIARDNLIDVAQPTVGPYYPAGWRGLLAIYVSNQAAWDPATPCLRAWGNRDSTGFRMPITVTDGGYIPRISEPQS